MTGTALVATVFIILADVHSLSQSMPLATGGRSRCPAYNHKTRAAFRPDSVNGADRVREVNVVPPSCTCRRTSLQTCRTPARTLATALYCTINRGTRTRWTDVERTQSSGCAKKFGSDKLDASGGSGTTLSCTHLPVTQLFGTQYQRPRRPRLGNHPIGYTYRGGVIYSPSETPSFHGTVRDGVLA